MTARVGAAGWLMLLYGVGCGGVTATSKPNDVAATAGTGSGNTAGTSSSTGGTNGTTTDVAGGAGDADGDGADHHPGCEGPQPVCLEDCTSRLRMVSMCVDFQYRCPEGWLDLDSCPKDACARRQMTCCAPSGRVALPDCTDDGLIGACPKGFEQKASCLPEGVDIKECAELMNGDACSSEEQVCYTSKCGRNCACNRDASGVLTWACSSLPC